MPSSLVVFWESDLEKVLKLCRPDADVEVDSLGEVVVLEVSVVVVVAGLVEVVPSLVFWLSKS